MSGRRSRGLLRRQCRTSSDAPTPGITARLIWAATLLHASARWALAATFAGFDGAVANGRMLQDRLYRLNVATVGAASFAGTAGRLSPARRALPRALPSTVYRRRLGHSDLAVATPALRALIGHGWPGNIRELEKSAFLAAAERCGPARPRSCTADLGTGTGKLRGVRQPIA